jgi:hypothetical protein
VAQVEESKHKAMNLSPSTIKRQNQTKPNQNSPDPYFLVLEFELRAFTLSQSASRFKKVFSR